MTMRRKIILGAVLVFALNALVWAKGQIEAMMIDGFNQHFSQILDSHALLMLTAGLIGIVIVSMHRV